jgi:DNA ligase-1
MTPITYFRIDSTGKIRQWTISVEKVDETKSKLISFAGVKDGKLIETITEITSGMNIGKANETTPYEQAVLDAQTEINKKVKQGYGLDLNNLKVKGQTATINAPMKAEVYCPFPKSEKEAKASFLLENILQVGAKKPKKGELIQNIVNQLIYIERKLDGWRFRLVVNRKGVKFHTSSGDETLAFPHIEKSVHNSFLKIADYVEKKYGMTEYTLDGEIYSKELGFWATASACGSTENLTPAKLELRSKMQFHIFDIVTDNPDMLIETRRKVAQYFVDNVNVLPVEYFEVIATVENIEKLMKRFLAEGFEGLMIKLPKSPYEFKYSRYWYKYKPVLDAEFKVVAINKSIAGDLAGSLKLELPDGRTFDANPMEELGTDEMKREMYANQSKYIGRWATCVFLEYSPDGIPRNPRVKAFRKGKSKD